ncbi:glycosyl hydrolase family 65 protein [Maribacter flavus]
MNFRNRIIKVKVASNELTFELNGDNGISILVQGEAYELLPNTPLKVN